MKHLCLATSLLVLFSAAPVAAETLRLAHELGYGGAESVDPISPNRFYPLTQLLYSRLVRQDEAGAIVPDLATEWTSSADATVWTFRLRPGVTFHNGDAFTADDVVFSLMRAVNPTIDSPVRAGLDLIKSVRAVDASTVEVTLKSAHADFPVLLADYRVRILDAKSCNNDQTKLCENGIGTGPFKLVKLDAVGTTSLARFDGYWAGPAGVDSVDVIAIADHQAQVAALQAGQIDMVLRVDRQELPLFAANPAFTVQNVKTGGWVGLAMRADTAPYTDARVRRALRIFADRDAMGKLVFGEGGYTVTCDNPVWAGDQYRADLTCPADIASAKSLLAEAGYPNGIDVKLYVSDIAAGAVRLVEVYQAQAKAAGINVEIVSTPADGYWNNVWMKEGFVATTWSQRPADQILNEAYRRTAAWNETFWKDAGFDALLDKARQDLNAESRKETYIAAQKQLFDEGGAFIPFHINETRVLSSRLSGLPAVEEFSIRYEDIKFAK